MKTKLIKEEDPPKEKDKNSETLPSLLEFLVDEEILNSFLTQSASRNAGKVRGSVYAYILENDNNPNAIGRALIWALTREGPNFWESIHRKWKSNFRS